MIGAIQPSSSAATFYHRNFTANLFLPYGDRFEIMCMIAMVALGFMFCLLIEPSSKQLTVSHINKGFL